jgi:hypothetical protein
MRVAVARDIFVARDATEKLEAVRRQAQIHEKKLLSLSCGSESRQGSRDNLRRFAERVMPKFGAPRAP